MRFFHFICFERCVLITIWSFSNSIDIKIFLTLFILNEYYAKHSEKRTKRRLTVSLVSLVSGVSLLFC